MFEQNTANLILNVAHWLSHEKAFQHWEGMPLASIYEVYIIVKLKTFFREETPYATPHRKYLSPWKMTHIHKDYEDKDTASFAKTPQAPRSAKAKGNNPLGHHCSSLFPPFWKHGHVTKRVSTMIFFFFFFSLLASFRMQRQSQNGFVRIDGGDLLDDWDSTVFFV